MAYGFGQFLHGLWPWGGGPADAEDAVTIGAELLAGMHSVGASASVSVYATVEVTSPAQTATSEINPINFYTVEVKSPVHTVESTAIVSVSADVAVTAPHMTVSASSVLPELANIAISSPMHSVASEVLVSVSATVEVTAPRMEVSASSGDNILATVEVISPMQIVTGVLSENVDATVNVSSLMHRVSSQTLPGVMASVEVTAPMHSVEVAETVVPVINVDSTMPMHVLEAFATVEASLTFVGVVVNTENFGNTNYSNYPFNSFCLFNGVYFGATADGVYSLTGGDDAGTDIDAVAKTGTVDTGRDSKVVPREAWLTGRFKAMKVRIYPGEGTPIEQSINEDGDGPREARVKFGRGHKERYFAWELLNKEGGDFEIDSYDVLAERKGALPLRRR